MSCLSNLSGCELVSLSNLIAVSIAQDLSSEEISILAALFTSIGDNLGIISTSKS